jgi:hypothetical protein
MRSKIQKLHRELGITSLFVTHDQVEAMTLAQRMIVMNAGRMEQFGTPEEVYHRPAIHLRRQLHRLAAHEPRPGDGRGGGGCRRALANAGPSPPKMVALWNNFRAAAEKNGWAIPAEPLTFLKAPNSFAAHGQTIPVPRSYDGRVAYEGELGIVIGKSLYRRVGGGGRGPYPRLHLRERRHGDGAPAARPVVRAMDAGPRTSMGSACSARSSRPASIRRRSRSAPWSTGRERQNYRVA